MDSSNKEMVSDIKARVNYFDLLPDLPPSRRMKCPIHSEAQNPTSFSVTQDGNYARCYNPACDFAVGGDVIDFIKIRDNVQFKQAISIVADVGGMTIKEWKEFDYSHFEKIERVMLHSVGIWSQQLNNNPEGMKYLNSRGITKENINDSMIGYAGSKGTLTSRLAKLGHSYDDMRKAGLIKQNNNDEQYVNRYIFPYWNFGKPVYSLGRADFTKFGKNENPPKYMKQLKTDYVRHIVYGQDVLWERNLERVFILEGVFDYWAAINMGWKCISACGGTISYEQRNYILTKLKKVGEIVICFDYDRVSEAGQKGSVALAKWLRRNGINARILRLFPPEDFPEDTKSYDLNDAYVARKSVDPESAKTFDDEQIAQIKGDYDKADDFLRLVYPSSTPVQIEYIKTKLKDDADIPLSATNAMLRAIKTVPERIIADRIIEKYEFVFHRAHGFRIYEGGIWKVIADEIVESWIIDEVDESITGKQLTSVLKLIKPLINISLPGDKNPFDLEKYRKQYISLKNGCLDVKTWKIEKHIKEAMFTHQVNVSYDPDAKCPRWMKFLDEITANDPDMIKLLQEIFGYCFLPDNRFQKFFIFGGDGANGKTRFLEVIEEMLGDSASSIPISQLHDKFALCDLYGKLVNITTEDKGDLIESSAALKAIVSGDTVRAEKKYRDAFRFRPYCKIICAMNQIPMTKDTSFGFFRRIQIVDWLVKFVDSEDEKEITPPFIMTKDIHLAEKLKKELQGVFNWAIEGLKRLMKNNKFTESQKHIKRQATYREEVDYVFRFFSEMMDDKMILPGQEYEKSDIYTLYQNWCIENGHSALSNSWFYRNESCRKATTVFRKRDAEGRSKRYVRITDDEQGEFSDSE